jgi:hypothetical protein
MFLDEAHRTTRNYPSLKAKVGKDIFGKGDRLEPYYTAAFALYRLEYLFRNGKLDAKYKAARFHILMATRLIAVDGDLPRMNSYAMETYCKQIMDILWDPNAADDLLIKAVAVVDSVAEDNFHRDNIRTEPFTKSVKQQCRLMNMIETNLTEKEK